MYDYNEIHFFNIPSQSNIYGISSMEMHNDSASLLVATIDSGVYSFDFKNLIPSCQEIPFSYIPAGAEIISIDAFKKSPETSDFVIGITFAKNGDQYFNIYSESDPDRKGFLGNLAQACSSLRLEFIPYQLTHKRLLFKDKQENAWFLTGSDHKVHLYREDKSIQTFIEEATGTFFPEFDFEVTSIIYWLDVLYYDDNKRLTAYGCESGEVTLFFTSNNESGLPRVGKHFTVNHGIPVSNVSLYIDELKYVESSTSCISLAVASTIEGAFVYRDVLNNNLAKKWHLPDSENFDCVTAALVADVDLDGVKEIVLTTYDQELVFYKANSDKTAYEISLRKSFRHPLLACQFLDITGDGLKELLVLSTSGLHVVQVDISHVIRNIVRQTSLKTILEGDESVATETNETEGSD